MIFRLFKNFFIVAFLLSCFYCCDDFSSKNNERTTTGEKRAEDLSSIDSYLKGVNQDSIIFLNYQNFIDEDLYNKIKQYNVAKGFLDVNSNYIAYANSESALCEILPVFEKGKLISIGLESKVVSVDYLKSIKLIYDKKYGNPTIDEYEIPIDLLKNLDYKLKHKKEPENQRFNIYKKYRYSRGNKIVELNFDKVYPEPKDFDIKEIYENASASWSLQVHYYTAKSIDYLSNSIKSVNDSKERLNKALKNKTQKDL